VSGSKLNNDDKMISPHGGKLVNRIASPEEKMFLKEKLSSLKRIKLTRRQLFLRLVLMGRKKGLC
jgi:ATP sulfurylase